jgi:hypothetical protein
LNPDGSPAALPLAMVPMGQVCVYVAPVTSSGELLAGVPSCQFSASGASVEVDPSGPPGVVCVNGESSGTAVVTATCGPTTASFEVVLAAPGSGVDAGGADDAASDAADAAEAPVCVIACGDASCVDPGTDPANCGGCGQVCAGTRQSGRCIETVVAAGNPYAIAANDDAVYWTEYADGGPSGAVMMAPADGGPSVVLASSQTTPRYIALDGTRAYWTTWSAVMAVGLHGGSPAPLAEGQGFPDGIAVDSANVYWTNESSGEVMEMALDGGTPTALVTIGTGANPMQLVAGAGNVYWIQLAEPYVLSVPIAGGTESTFFYDSEYDVAAIASDSVNLYYTQQSFDAPVGVCPLDGASPATIANGNNGTLGVVSDGSNVYFTSPNGDAPIFDGAVLRVPLDGGSAVTLATGGAPSAIAVNATNVYWTSGTSGAVLRTAK